MVKSQNRKYYYTPLKLAKWPETITQREVKITAKAYFLIVDDDEDVGEKLKLILEENGYEIYVAKSGKEAIEKLKKNHYDLALFEIKLPDIEGAQLLTKMKDTTPNMVKIIFTGYASLKNAVDALNYGAYVYVMKPVNPKELLELIEKKGVKVAYLLAF